MTRPCTVFPNAQLAHVWAQQRQSAGRSANGNFYFEGPCLYSYGARADAGWLETSRGARVPLPDALRAFALIERVRNRGEPWSPTDGKPLRVGHFTVDRIDANGDIRAGCHKIRWPEIERAAVEAARFGQAPTLEQSA
jgi:hypothetical protein